VAGYTEDLRANTVSATAFSLLLGVVGAMAVILAGSGIIAVVSYTAALRTREFEIRIALGASPAEVRGLVMRQAMKPVALGLVLGLTDARCASTRSAHCATNDRLRQYCERPLN
jgi:putative ABC transport system permease protein